MLGTDRLTGRFRELLALFSPLLLMSFCSCLFFIIEKVLLARLSVKDMEAAVNAFYAAQIFQLPCVSLAMMAQVFVGRWCGAKQPTFIGSGIWQFIWFSFLSMIITVPFSILYGRQYFGGMGIEDIVLPYYNTLVFSNFLYPLGASLSCFYLGMGRVKFIMIMTILAHCVRVILGYFLIFGWAPYFPKLGLLGGAVSLLLSQAGLCLFLLLSFLSATNRRTFHSWDWKFKPKLFWECIHPGMLRAFNRILNSASWASVAYLMATKGNEYILILSIGGTLFLFLPFVADAICQALTTVVSHLIGARQFESLEVAFRSGTLLVLISIVVSSIPFIFFSVQTFESLFPNITLGEESIRKIFLGLWVCLIFFNFSFVPISYILAYKDTLFSLFMGFVGWVNGFLLMYVAIKYVDISADLFWLVLSLTHASTALIYYYRMRWLQAKSIEMKIALE